MIVSVLVTVIIIVGAAVVVAAVVVVVVVVVVAVVVAVVVVVVVVVVVETLPAPLSDPKKGMITTVLLSFLKVALSSGLGLDSLVKRPLLRSIARFLISSMLSRTEPVSRM